MNHDPLLDSIADGVFSVDLDFRITAFNRAAETITGIPREDALGQICCEVFRANICEAQCAIRETLKSGAPVIDKPIYIINGQGDRIPVSISTAIFRDACGQVIGGVETFRDLSQVEALRKELEKRYSFADIISRNSAMQRLFDLMPQIAESNSSVLVTGESGTGKELVARGLHSLSHRSEKPFVAVNCGALPDTLLESELFGYKKGAFTDARTDKPGRFARAHGGTLFLDEIGDISLQMQVKLLRVLETHTFEPLGSVQPEITHVRIIAATHRDLEQMVQDGSFREDLYYRINIIQLHIPPLRERMEDLPLLVDHFINRFNHLQGKHISGITDQALSALMGYEFPGNVRELQNFIERAFVLLNHGLIDTPHLADPVLSRSGEIMSQPMTLAELERLFILKALERNGGNRDSAARELGIHRSTLYRKIKSLNLDEPG